MWVGVGCVYVSVGVCFFFQAEDGVRGAKDVRGLGDVFKRRVCVCERSIDVCQAGSYIYLTLAAKRMVWVAVVGGCIKKKKGQVSVVRARVAIRRSGGRRPRHGGCECHARARVGPSIGV